MSQVLILIMRNMWAAGIDSWIDKLKLNIFKEISVTIQMNKMLVVIEAKYRYFQIDLLNGKEGLVVPIYEVLFWIKIRQLLTDATADTEALWDIGV